MFTKLKRLIFPTTRYPLMMDRLNKDHYECDISGTKFSVDTFPSNMGFDHSKEDVTRIDLDDPKIYLNREHKYEHFVGEPLTPEGLFYRRPEIRRGFLGRESMYHLGVGAGLKHFHTMPDSMNLFYPPHFLQAIEYLHYYVDGPSCGDPDQRFYTGWRYEDIADKQWWNLYSYQTEVREELEAVDWNLAKLGLTDDTNKNILNMYRFRVGRTLFLPIGKRELVYVGVSLLYPYAPIEDAYAAFEDFAEEMFQTLRVDYGPRALADRAKLGKEQLNEYPELDPTFCLQKKPHIMAGSKEDTERVLPLSQTDFKKVVKYGDRPPVWRP